MKKRSFLILFCLITVCAFGGASAQGLRFSVDGGASKPVGKNEELLHWGFSVGGNVMYSILDYIWIGGRVAYNRWGYNESEFIDRVTSLNLTDGDVEKGAGWAIELVPTIRLMSSYPVSPINFFLHGGAGLYFLNLETKVNGGNGNQDVSETVSTVFGNDVTRFGIQVGGGIILGSARFLSVELFPLYHLVFNGQNHGTPFHYFSINLGVGIGI